jgi:hypothetical protein
MILLACKALTCELDKIRTDVYRAYLSGIGRTADPARRQRQPSAGPPRKPAPHPMPGPNSATGRSAAGASASYAWSASTSITMMHRMVAFTPPGQELGRPSAGQGPVGASSAALRRTLLER